MSRRDERAETLAQPNINVTPFIDILLVLLIIFMVITPLKPTRFKALIPAPPTNDPIEKLSPRTLVVDVSPDYKLKLTRAGELIAEGTIQDAGALASTLAGEFAARRAQHDWRPDALDRTDLSADERIQKTVFIKAPRSISYGEVARVIDSVKGAGAAPVGLQTDELIN